MKKLLFVGLVFFMGCTTVSYYYPLGVAKNKVTVTEKNKPYFEGSFRSGEEISEKVTYLKNGEIRYKGRFLFGYTGSNMLREIVEIEKELRRAE